MDWKNIKRFCFTHAIAGGAWVEDANGYRNWESYSTIVKHMGKAWFDAQRKAQGMFTGCWIDCK